MLFKSLLLAGLLVGGGECQRWTRTRTGTLPPPPVTTPTQAPTRTQAPSTTQAQGPYQTLYGQCGGKTYVGPTICPAGSYCKNDGINEWYSQCVSIEDSQPAGDSPITRTRTTTISVIGPSPSVVTTFITYLTPVNPPAATTITLIPDEPYTPTWP